MKNRPNPSKILMSLIELLSGLKVRFRTSFRGVPHLIINDHWSVCYFEKGQFYRVFYPYASKTWNDKQIKKTFKVVEEVAEYFNSGNYKELELEQVIKNE